MKKKILLSILILCLIIVIPVSAYADGADGWEDLIKQINSQNSYENISGSGVASTGYMKEGVIDQKQGWIIYGINKYGQVIAKPYIIGTGFEECEYKELTTRYGRVTPYDKANINIPKSFYFDSSYAAHSNWENVRNYVWNNLGEGDSILDLWGGEFKESFSEEKKDEYDNYLIIEPFYWHGLHKKNASSGEKLDLAKIAELIQQREQFLINAALNSREGKKLRMMPSMDGLSVEDMIRKTAAFRMAIDAYRTFLIAQQSFSSSKPSFEFTGETYCGTVYNGASFEDSRGDKCFDGVYSFRHGGFCTFIKYTKELAGVGNALKPSNINNSDIKHSGYGIAAFSNKGPDYDVPNDVPEENKNYNPVSLYETKNYDHTNTFDISEAIPSSEWLTNEINVSSFVGDGNFITIKEQNSSRIWTATCNYYYTVHDWYHIDDYWENETLVATVSTQAEADSYDSNLYNVSPVGLQWNVYRKAHWHYGNTERRDIDSYNTYTYPIKTNTYAFNAFLKYQYIDQTPHIYTWQDTTVTNGSYNSAYYNKMNSKVPAEVKAVATLWNNGTGVSTIVTSSEAYPSVTYKGSSDHYSWSGNITNTSCNVVTLNRGYGHSDETVGYNFNAAVDRHEYNKVKELAAKVQNGTKSRNDGLKINDVKAGQHTALDDSWVTGCTVNAYRGSSTSGTFIATFDGADASSAKGYSGLFETINTNLTASRVSAKQELQIPVEKANADYTTGMSVNWINIFDDTTIYNAKAGSTVGSGESIYKHVMRDGILPHHTGTLLGDEADGYPVRVHTPVESPVKIVDKYKNEVNEDTQLISGSSLNASVDNQLLLDRNYYIEWDNEAWISAVYGETPVGYENIFDRYVTAKYMQFPFSVVYNNKLYEADATGYTEWIEVAKPGDVRTPWNYNANRDKYESSNHWQMTPFYIPTFATECGFPNEDVWVNVKVSAINVGPRLGEKDTKVYMADVQYPIADLDDYDSSLSQNSVKNNYVAICDKKIQLSGWVYDFSIVGTSNLALYTGEDLEDIDTYKNNWPMAQDKKELKTGPYNRLGNNYIRFLIDGTVENTLDQRQLLPFRDGSSYRFSEMGAIWRGQNFAFTLKTIANLDKQYDSIDITPSYTYVKKDGTVVSGDNLCYVEVDKYAVDTPDDNATVKSLVFHAYDPGDTDMSSKWVKEYSLSDRLFRESYYDNNDVTSYHYADWVNRSTDNENKNTGAITFPNLVDSNEYLRRKINSWSISHINLPAESRYISGEYEQLERNEGLSGSALNTYSFNGYGASQEALFKNSMQQWNGMFGVPTFARFKDVTGISNFDIYDYLEELTHTNGGFSWDEDFEPLDGTLIIDFNIVVNKTYCEDCGCFVDWTDDSHKTHHLTSRPYLQYNGAGGGGLNMWQTEGHMKDPAKHIDEDTVVIVDISRSVNDYFEVGLFNIN